MIRPLLSALLILAVCYSAFAQNPSPTATQLRSDSLTLTVFPVTTQSPDSLKLQKGDSVFVFGGEQYFRARMGDKEFFISRQALLAHADSLIIYQYSRLGNTPQVTSTADTTVAKVVRQQCSMITKNGTRCKRLAEPGSDRCWQHKK
ncbi:MAG TPA: hypothetical protein DCZ43_10800 [candidate division Zixibacteria bacterium]|nr:hypothetical protein [candidate division Zixibacteria bacterium]